MMSFDSIWWIRFGADKSTGYPKFWESIIFYFCQILDCIIGLATLGLVHMNFGNWATFNLAHKWRKKPECCSCCSCDEEEPLTRIDAINCMIHESKHNESEQMEKWCTKDKIHYLKTFGHTDEDIEHFIAEYLGEDENEKRATG